MITLLLMTTMLLWGATPIIEKIGLSKADPLVAVTVRSMIVTMGLLLLTFLLGRGKAIFEMDVKTFLLFALSGFMAGLLGMWTYYTALKMGATSKVVPIAACYPLITALLSVLILKEGLTLGRIVGTALIVAGIWLVK